MSLRHLVPTLGALALIAGAHGADSNPLAIGGFIDTIGSVSDTQDDHLSAAYGFQAASELRIGAKIADNIATKLEVEWNNTQHVDPTTGAILDTRSYNGHPGVYVEQAFITYTLSDEVSVNAGKATSYAGWVSADADGLYRINAGPIVSLYGTELVGTWVNWSPVKPLSISFFLTNGLGLDIVDDRTNDNNDNPADPAHPKGYLSPAVDIRYDVDGLGSFNLEGGYDYHGSDWSTWSVGANATIKPKSYDKLTLGLEAIMQKTKNNLAVGTDTDRLGLLGMVNHALPNAGKFASSLTLMGQMLDVDPDVGDETRTDEVALALLTNPTGDTKLGVNLEVSYKVTKTIADVGSDPADIKQVWAGLEMLAVFP